MGAGWGAVAAGLPQSVGGQGTEARPSPQA